MWVLQSASAEVGPVNKKHKYKYKYILKDKIQSQKYKKQEGDKNESALKTINLKRFYLKWEVPILKKEYTRKQMPLKKNTILIRKVLD